MTSSFSGLSTALSALYAQRRGLDVTGQNIANANTAGYTRQRVNMESVGAPAVPALWSNYSGAGGGVAVTDVQRLRDSFLESRGRTEQGTLSLLTGQQDTLAGVERSFQEPGETGLQSQLADLWSAWHDVATHPGDLAARSQLLATTANTADGIRATYSSLDAQWTAGHEQLGTSVAAINATATNVAELNQAILTATSAGIPSNELSDKRDLLVMNLAQLTGATARTAANGSVDVFLGGTALVRGSSAAELSVTGAKTLEEARANPLVAGPTTVIWTGTGAVAEVGGDAGARVESLVSTIPSYADKLDVVVTNLRDTVNRAHLSTAANPTYDLNGNPGTNIFDPAATAKDIRGLITDPNLVAASREAPTASGPSLDGSNAAGLADIGQLSTGPDAVYRQLVVKLGAAAQTANRRLEIQSSVAGDIDAARESQAGVNIDEEMVNLLSFQRAYESAARVISTVDSTLDTLINRTGLVGR